MAAEEGELDARMFSPWFPPKLNLTGMATPALAMFTTLGLATGLKKPVKTNITVTEQLSVPLLAALSVMVTVYGKVPFTVGVPEITPPEEMLRPVGRPVAETVYGAPAAPPPTSVAGVMAEFCTAL